ncbi:MYCBP-associated protein-like isoform X2 [Apostichopus japonicus]|uniref:MYCBP-associated protein-like isoform X2 n=1 Tax=Stichopus japonicus TaxID=307972 RepID=UPI003AB53D76
MSSPRERKSRQGSPTSSLRKRSSSRNSISSEHSTSVSRSSKRLTSGFTMVHLIGSYKSKSTSRNKRDGTPEKPVSPTQSQLLEEEVVPPSKQVLDGDDIQALAIQQNDLTKLHAPKPPEKSAGPDKNKRVVVRKLKPQSELDKPPLKTVLIAKPAPPHAPIKSDDFSGISGPRFDASGNIIPHSILGTMQEFTQEAAQQGHVTIPPGIQSRPQTPSVKSHQKDQTSQPAPRDSFLDENKALINWQRKMIDRKRQQGYISKLLQKPVDTLVMNQASDFRKTQEQRYLIDRTIPAVDYGKGYRVGSEFWKQQERIGNDLSGIHMTLSQTERGYAPPVEHIRNPNIIKEEMGLPVGEGRNSPVYYPWHQSQYLKQRRDQLIAVMEELDPFKPDLDSLHVSGTNKPHKPSTATKSSLKRTHETREMDSLENQENIAPSVEKEAEIMEGPVSGPCLVFQGFRAGWTGDSCSGKGQVASGARVTFESFAGERTTAYLELVNDGTTSLHYDWKKIPKVNPFEAARSNSKVQRFYFNTSSGVLLPGDKLQFPFIFKSPNPGIFSETWQLDTKPTLCGGATLQVTLRGIALQEDKTKKQRNDIEQELYHRQAEVAVRRVLDEIVDGIRTPQRARSPVDAYITEEEQFEKENPQMHYSNEVVTNLKELWKDLYDDEDDLEVPPWNFSVQGLKEELLGLEDEERREELLTRLNSSVASLSFPPLMPVQQEQYRLGYQLMMEAADMLDAEAESLRISLGFPEKNPTYPSMPDILSANDTLRGGPPKEKSDPKKNKKGKDDDKKDKKDGKKGKKDDKDKDRPKSKQDKSRAGKSRETSSPKPLRERKTPRGDRKVERMPVRPYPPPSETGDPVLDAKYRNKLYIMVYNLLGDTAEQMAGLFEDIQKKQELNTLQ